MEQSDIIAIQESLAHQSADIARLSEELFAQQREIHELRSQLAILYARMKAMNEMTQQLADATPEPPPPHY